MSTPRMQRALMVNDARLSGIMPRGSEVSTPKATLLTIASALDERITNTLESGAGLENQAEGPKKSPRM